MARVAVQTQGPSGVLHRAVGVEEQRGHGAYLGAASLLEQRLDPARVDDLRVVVEEDENVGAGRAGGGIVERGEGERPGGAPTRVPRARPGARAGGPTGPRSGPPLRSRFPGSRS